MLVNLILCPIDFSEFSTRAYRHALSLAEHYGAQLVVLHVVELWRYPFADYAATAGDYAQFCQSLHEAGVEKLKEFVKNYICNEIQPELVVREGRAPDTILSFAKSQKTDLIVMGTHGRRGFDRLMLGSTTDRVMREASHPVLAVCQAPRESVAASEKGHYVHHLNRILLCTDFSENSERALEYAISATEEYNAELTLMHVVEHVASAARMGEVVATCTQQLDKLIPPEKRKTLKMKTVVRIGEPYQQIIEYTQQAQIDLVMMGVRGAGALDRAIFGSTTYRVIQLGPCPVLVVQV
jgi:nucleotide-binding universal stress UspA family protein